MLMLVLEHRAIVLATLVASLLLFVTDALRYDLVAVLVVLVLAATGCLTVEEAFAGFSSPAIVLIASMYVFGHAMTRCGVAERIGQRLLVRDGGGEAWLALRVTLVAGILSSILSNTGVVAALIPVLGAVSRQCRVPVSRLLMPLSFGSLLGGMLTVIGTSTNIAINEAIRKNEGVPFELFEFTLFCSVFLVVGCAYFLSPLRRLLPTKRVGESLTEHYQVPRFVSEVLVEPNSTLINRTVAEVELFEQNGISVLGIARSGDDSIAAPGPYNRIRGDDTLILQGEPEAIVRVRQQLGLSERKHVDVGDMRLTASDVQLVEAVVPAGSSLIGRSLAESEFRARSGLNVLGLSKHGDVQPRSISTARLELGDALLVQGHEPDIARIRRNRELLILGEVASEPIGRGAVTTVVVLALVLVAAAMKWMELPVAATLGAVLLVLTRTVNAEDLRHQIDWSVLILIGGMLSLGYAFERHGLGADLAAWIGGLGAAGDSPRFLLALLLIATVALTQVMNHVTSAVIMTPIAMSFAHETAASDRPFLMAVVVGANLAFLSPVAHQANAMVMGPGDYRYRDFIQVGLPLTIALSVLAVALIPLVWDFAL